MEHVKKRKSRMQLIQYKLNVFWAHARHILEVLCWFLKKFNGVFIILVIFLAVGVFSDISTLGIMNVCFRHSNRYKNFQITSYFDQIEREGIVLLMLLFILHNDVNISAALRHRLSNPLHKCGWLGNKDGRFFLLRNSNGESYYQKKAKMIFF